MRDEQITLDGILSAIVFILMFASPFIYGFIVL